MDLGTRLILSLAITVSGRAHAQTLGEVPLQQTSAQHPSVRVVQNYVNPDFARPRATPLASGAGMNQLFGRTPAGRSALSLSSCYANTNNGSSYFDLTVNREIADWGSKACGSTNIVGKIGFGIRTTNLPVSQGGPGFRIGMRLHGSGGGPGVRGPLIADYTISGDGVPFAPAPAALITGEFVLPTPIIVGDYNPFGGWDFFHWSYYHVENATDPLLVTTTGAPCGAFFSGSDPSTGTYDCIEQYISSTGLSLGQFTPFPGLGSLYLQLWEEDPFPALIQIRQQAPNVLSYSCDPIVIGDTWDASVNVSQSGHSLALVFGFDTPFSLTLSGGQVLLVLDAGSGEMLGLTSMGGPLANFSVAVPFDLALVGRYVGTQAIAYGSGVGVTTFALTNAVDCTIGTH